MFTQTGSLIHEREFKLGILLAKRNQHLDALDRFKNLLSRHPNRFADVLIPLYKQLISHYLNLPLRMLIAELYLSQNMEREAIYELEEAISLDPAYSQSYVILSKIYKKNKYRTTIKSLFEKCVADGHYDSSITDLLPKIYIEDKQLDKGIALYQALLKESPDHIPFKKNLAILLSKNAQYPEAADIYVDLSEQSPDHLETCAQDCESLLERCPDNIDLRQKTSMLHLKSCNPERATQHIHIMTLSNPELHHWAIDVLKKSLETYPNHRDLSLSLTDSLIHEKQYSEAVSHLQLLSQAEEEDALSQIVMRLETILKAYPNQLMAQFLLAQLYRRQGQAEKVIPYLDNIIQTDPDYPGLRDELHRLESEQPEQTAKCTLLSAKLALKQQQWQQCEQALQQLEDSPLRLDARLCYVQLLLEKGLLLEAKNNAFSLLEEHPHHADLHRLLLKVTRQQLKSEQQARQEAPPNSAQDSFKLGMLALRSQHIHEALEAFQNVTNQDPGAQVKAQLMMARTLIEGGRFEAAQKRLNQVQPYVNKTHIHLLTTIQIWKSITYFHRGMYGDATAVLKDTVVNVNASRALMAYSQTLENLCKGRAGQYTLAATSMTHSGSLIPMLIYQDDTDNGISLAQAQNEKGCEHILNKQENDAAKEFNIALQLEPEQYAAYCNLAIRHLLGQKLGEAKHVIENIPKSQQQNAFVMHTKGLINSQDGHSNDAKKAFYIAQKHQHLAPIAQLNLGDVYFAEGDIRQAHYYWREAAKHLAYSFLCAQRLRYLKQGTLNFDYWIGID